MTAFGMVDLVGHRFARPAGAAADLRQLGSAGQNQRTLERREFLVRIDRDLQSQRARLSVGVHVASHAEISSRPC